MKKYILLAVIILIAISHINAENNDLDGGKQLGEDMGQTVQVGLVDYVLTTELYEVIDKTALAVRNAVINRMYLIVFALWTVILIYKVNIGKADFQAELPRLLILTAILLGYQKIIPLVGQAISMLAHIIYEPTGQHTLLGPLGDVAEGVYGDFIWKDWFNPFNIISYLSFMVMGLAVNIMMVVIVLLQGLLYIFGPIAIALSIIDYFAETWKRWLGAFVTAGFWGVTLAVVLRIVSEYTAILAKYIENWHRTTPTSGWGDMAQTPAFIYMICMNIVIIVMIILIPKITSAYLQIGGEQISNVAAMMAGAGTAGGAIVGGKMITAGRADLVQVAMTTGSNIKGRAERISQFFSKGKGTGGSVSGGPGGGSSSGSGDSATSYTPGA